MWFYYFILIQITKKKKKTYLLYLPPLLNLNYINRPDLKQGSFLLIERWIEKGDMFPHR